MKFFLTSILLGISLLPASVLAQNFLVGIPGIGSPTGNFDGYINAIYAMFISIAALLAVVKIVIAGVKYMFTDIVPQKTQAKQDIQGAIFGLILILGAVLILTVINPDLTNFNLEQNQIALPDPLPQDDPSSDGVLSILEFCEQNDGNCEVRSCDALDDYTGGMILAGATIGLIAPGIGPLIGAAVGGVGGLVLNYAGTATECRVVCNWLDGDVVDVNGQSSCRHPVDALESRRAILEARQQILREQYDCTDGRLIMSGSPEIPPNCIRDLTDTQSQNILTLLEVNPDSTIAESITNRIQNFAIQDYIISDTSTISELTQTFNVERIVMALEIPISTSVSDKTNIETNFNGICVDAGFDTIFETVNSVQYAVCGE